MSVCVSSEGSARNSSRRNLTHPSEPVYIRGVTAAPPLSENTHTHRGTHTHTHTQRHIPTWLRHKHIYTLFQSRAHTPTQFLTLTFIQNMKHNITQLVFKNFTFKNNVSTFQKPFSIIIS